MTPREHMERHARRAPGGGIAWERSIFQNSPSSTSLIDAAVDLAWERLQGARPGGRANLDIRQTGRMLVIRLAGPDRSPELPLVA